MGKRYAAIWFRHLMTDWYTRRQPQLQGVPFVLVLPEHGRMVVQAASASAENKGIHKGMVAADGRAILPTLQVFDHIPGQAEKLLNALAEWALRYTPIACVDMPDGLILDISGCAHLWGGEHPYLKDMLLKLRSYGYDAHAGLADTVATAWAVARYGQGWPIIKPGAQMQALQPLPPAALRISPGITERLLKLGLYQIDSFMHIPRQLLKKRFGAELLIRLDQALGQEMEIITPVHPIPPYQERLPSLEPIRTAIGIEIAMKRLLEALCLRLSKEQKGITKAIFKGYRIDGLVQQIAIGTSKASRNTDHLFKLLELKIANIAPGLGIELFILEATVVEELTPEQEALWNVGGSHDTVMIAQLLDKLAGKVGSEAIHRYLPEEHYWPERAVKNTKNLQEKPQTEWRTDQQRPLLLLQKPETITVMVPLPDYPPLHFNYKGKTHRIKKADGPERIEREWWIDNGDHRDYYCVEDEDGARYWLFRAGHYAATEPEWFIHGFFA